MIANVSKTNTGKLLVAVLAMFMIVAGAAVVLGSEVNATGDSDAEDGVASIEDQSYPTLDDAVNAATSGTADAPVEITLLRNATLGEFLKNVVISAEEKYTITLTNSIEVDGTVGLKNVEIATQGEVLMAFYTGNYQGQNPITFSMENVSFDKTVNNDGNPSTVYLDGANTVTITGSDFTNTRLVYAGATDANPQLTLDNTTNVDMNVSSSDAVVVGTDIIVKGTSTIGDVRLTGGVEFTVPNGVTFTAKNIGFHVDDKGTPGTGTIVTNDPSNIVTETPTEVPIQNTDGTDYVTEVEDGKTYEDVCFHNVTVNPGVTISVKGSIEISGDFRLFGTINNADTTDVTINVPKGATFTAYSGASFGKNVYLDGAGKIDVSAAMEDFQVNQNVNGDYIYPQFQRVIITDTLTIKSGNIMTVLGELVINEGVTLIVEAGATLQIGDNTITAVGVTVNGTIEIEEGATVNGIEYKAGQMDVVNAQNVTVSGEIVANGNLTVKSNVTIKSGGTITVEDSDDASITVKDGNNFVIEANGNLNISGKMDIASISNKGTITLSEAKVVGNTDSVITMAADGATVNIESFTSNGKKLSIVDADLIAGKDENKQDVVIGTTKGTKSNTISFTGFSGVTDTGLEGITIVESVTSETVNKKIVYTNTMYISGNVDVVDERQNVAEGSAAAQYNINFNGASGIAVATEESFVLGEGVVLNFWGGILNVDGEISAVDATVADRSGKAANVYVDGTFLTADDKLDDIMNAFHYSVKSTTTTDKHEVYTNLANALANSQDIEYLGEVEILESVTIPAGTEIEAVDSAKMTIGDSDHRDIVVTFANGSTFRNGGNLVIVNATLVAENYKKDLKITYPQSDVQIDEGDKRTYTNIYTALNNAENGTVTIRQNATVFLDDDIEVKSGVTLVIPANTNLYMDNGVIMTVNGTVENSGNIASMIPNPDEKAATTTAYVAGDGFKPLDKDEVRDPATIVVNGAFKSMTFTAYDTYYIPGAYYQIIDTEGAWYWITPVEAAAAVASTAEDGISIYGEVTVGDVAFNGTEDVTVEVTIMNGAELNAGTITLSRAVIGFEEDGTGAFTGTIGSAAGSVAFVNANGFTMDDSVDQDDAETTSLVGTAKKAIADGADAAVTVTTGDITVDGLLDVNGVAFTIASGATVTVTGSAAELTTEGATNDKLSVDGTLVVTENGTVDVKILTVRGTLNVLPADRDNGVNAGKMEVETLYVGIAQDKDDANAYGDASAGTVSADVTSKPTTIVVSAESTITGKLIEGMNSTEFFVEDTLWITVYGTGDIATYNSTDEKTDYGYIPADLAECKFNGWNDADGKLITATLGKDIAVGDEKYKQVYANIDYNVYKVYITLDNTVGSVAIDGQMLVYQNGAYTLPNGQLLTAGQHTVTYTLAANYEGTPTLSSQNVTVSGMTFTLSGDYEDVNATGDKTINYYLSLGGATLADTSIVIDGGSGDDGMSLTDILLIVLVVLILVMAIIVALRLMRS